MWMGSDVQQMCLRCPQEEIGENSIMRDRPSTVTGNAANRTRVSCVCASLRAYVRALPMCRQMGVCLLALVRVGVCIHLCEHVCVLALVCVNCVCVCVRPDHIFWVGLFCVNCSQM